VFICRFTSDASDQRDWELETGGPYRSNGAARPLEQFTSRRGHCAVSGRSERRSVSAMAAMAHASCDTERSVASPDHEMMFLTLCGSLRAASSNLHALRAAALIAPPGIAIEHYDAIGSLPHFNPDLDDALPAAVVDLRERVNRADGLLISCPEYARGIPGSFKNALDWLVGSPLFPGKPVALFNTSPRAFAAQDALKLVLETMSAVRIADACITLALLGKETSACEIAADATNAALLDRALVAMAEHVSAHPRMW
jgi:chromate reductase, NAD(P)H dehydrogenase (quinone)